MHQVEERISLFPPSGLMIEPRAFATELHPQYHPFFITTIFYERLDIT